MTAANGEDNRMEWVSSVADPSRSKGLIWNVMLLTKTVEFQVTELAAENARLREEMQTVQNRLAETRAQAADLEMKLGGLTAKMERMAYALDVPGTCDLPDRLQEYYKDFEDRNRGSEELIRSRQMRWLELLSPWFGTVSGPVVDLGCGRGEWLALLDSAAVQGLGVEQNPGQVAHCQERGLRVIQTDMFSWIREQPDGSAGFYTAFQVIEHMSLQELAELVAEMYRTLEPGGGVALETLNPTSLLAHQWFVMDPTHRKFLHPATLVWMLENSGFKEAKVEFANPPPRLAMGERVADYIDDVINGPIDYLVTARK